MRISDWSSDVCSSDLVSSIATNLPGMLVKTSATWNGCDRKRWILRARATVSLSSSLSSSMPRMAMMRSEEHTSELQSLMRISYAVFCLKKKKKKKSKISHTKNMHVEA